MQRVLPVDDADHATITDLTRAALLVVALIGDVLLVAFSLCASQPWLCAG